MRQLMHGDRRPRRTGRVEELDVHLVVAAEVVHVHQVRRHAHQILEPGADLAQDVADVLDHGPGLLPDVEPRRAELVDRSTRDRVVRPPPSHAGTSPAASPCPPPPSPRPCASFFPVCVPLATRKLVKIDVMMVTEPPVTIITIFSWEVSCAPSPISTESSARFRPMS